MKARLTWLLPVLALVICSSSRSVAEDITLLVIVNPSVRASELSADQLEAIFTLSDRQWPGGEAIIPFNYPPGSVLRESFDRAVLRMAPEEVARFWIDQRIRGIGDAPRKVPTAAILLRVVANLRGAIGYVPSGPIPADVKLVARVSAGKVLRAGGR
jgi:ABC-type phosphate transport system substrate-binding protein